MAYSLGEASRKKLKGVNPRLVKVVERAIELTEQDFSVLEGVRTLSRQKWLYAQGRTRLGPIVTWTLKSKHIDGEAVDLVPYPLDWNTPSKFDAIYDAMIRASFELNIPIRSGMDWDRDGVLRERKESDSPHYELA